MDPFSRPFSSAAHAAPVASSAVGQETLSALLVAVQVVLVQELVVCLHRLQGLPAPVFHEIYSFVL